MRVFVILGPMPLLRTALRERIADRLTGGALSSQRRDITALDASLSHVKEALMELEAERRVSGGSWVNSAGGTGKETNDFSRQEIRNIARDGRLKYLKSPLIRRAVDVSALYTFAQGVTVHCEDDKANAVLQEFWDERTNRRVLTSTKSLFIKEVERKTQGNIFFALFHETGGTPRIRRIPADQISEVITDPNDEEEVWFYRRVWTARVINETSGIATTEARDEYYPALDYPFEAPAMWGGKPVIGARVYHLKTGMLSDMEFGVADTYPSHAPDTTYTEFLEDRAAVVASLSIFAWMGKARNGISRLMGGLQSAASRGVRRALQGGSNIPAGQIGGLRDGDSLEPVNVAGATINPDEGRAFRLEVVNAQGLSEPLGTGDVSTGNLATAESLDWPTALLFMLVQAIWEEVFVDIARYVLQVAGFDTKELKILVDWPKIIKENTKDSIDALVAAANLFPDPAWKEFIARRVISALGEDEADKVLKKINFEAPKPTTDPALLNGHKNGKVPVGAKN